MATTKRETKAVEKADIHIAELAVAAARAGDLRLVKLCGRALTGNKGARTECMRTHVQAHAIAKHLHRQA